MRHAPARTMESVVRALTLFVLAGVLAACRTERPPGQLMLVLDGNVFVAGPFYDYIDFGSGEQSANGTLGNIFVAKFAP